MLTQNMIHCLYEMLAFRGNHCMCIAYALQLIRITCAHLRALHKPFLATDNTQNTAGGRAMPASL